MGKLHECAYQPSIHIIYWWSAVSWKCAAQSGMWMEIFPRRWV